MSSQKNSKSKPSTSAEDFALSDKLDVKNESLESLQKIRKSDVIEEYQQDMIESYAQKRVKVESSSDEEYQTEEDGTSINPPPNKMFKNDSSKSNAGIGMHLMMKAGYKEGTGLGRAGQGIVVPIGLIQQHGRVGLGHEGGKALAPNAEFEIDAGSEIKSIEEYPSWVECADDTREQIRSMLSSEWIVETKPKKIIDDEDRFCERNLIAELVNCKNVFNYLDNRTLNDARARANPYETVKAGFFQNRAAMKTANLDKIYDWRISREVDPVKRHAKNPIQNESEKVNSDRESSIFYFADVCAGPGGFSEYMLWRKAFYNAKGFGFTLKNSDDFKLWKFKAAPSEYFETYYGENGDGNVMDPANLISLENFVKARTPGSDGVHLVMCDGGFSVEGQENIQEILSKRLYLCQFIVGLSLCRVQSEGKSGGNFFCKLFDIFTPFSVGLVYLLYAAFEKVSLHKPLTSRPANSERYIFCENLTEFGATVVKEYLVQINNRLENIAEQRRKEIEDIYEIVPHDIMAQDENFFNYVVEHNHSVIKRQIFYLKKYRLFAQDKGSYDSDQGRIREECLGYWELPNLDRITDTDNRRPSNITLRKLAGEKIVWSNQRTPFFNLDIVRQIAEKHLPSAEIRAVLLPDSTEPSILVTSGGSEMTIYDRAGRYEKFFVPNSVLLPRDTILLVQKAEKYDENMKAIGQILYIVDVAVLNGDDVSNLPLRFRLNAGKKFCAAVNKVDYKLEESAAIDRKRVPTTTVMNSRNKERKEKREYKLSSTSRYELIVAEPIRLQNLVQTSFETKPYRGAKVALFDLVGEGKYKTLCRGVRFVNILRQNWRIFWSKTSKEEYLHDFARNVTLKIPEAKLDTYSNFYDCYNSAATVNASSTSNAPETRVWMWTWDMQYNNDFGVLNILNDEYHKNGITLKALKNALDEESQKIECC